MSLPRETLTVLRCDRCNAEGTVYTVRFDDEGVKEFVLCGKHNARLEQLRGLSYGTWHDMKPKRKRGIHKVDPKDIGLK